MIKCGRHTYNSDRIEKVYFGNENEHDIIIGNFTSLPSKLRIYTEQGKGHHYKRSSTYPFSTRKYLFNSVKEEEKNFDDFLGGNVIIGNDVWIGEHVTITPGRTIGDGSVIATNSHIVRNVKPYSIVGGNPAKLLKWRFSEAIIKKFLDLKWWDLEDDQINLIMPYLQSVPTIEMFDEIYKILEK